MTVAVVVNQINQSLTGCSVVEALADSAPLAKQQRFSAGRSICWGETAKFTRSARGTRAIAPLSPWQTRPELLR